MEKRFTLEPYNGKATRYDCPMCQDKHSFSRYIDVQTKEHLHPNVGKCNHDGSCGYHYKPRQYFTENNIVFKPTLPTPNKVSISKVIPVPIEILTESLKGYQHNTFTKFLCELFGAEKTQQLVGQYFIGTSHDCYRKETGNWQGAALFWFIDVKGRIRAGQVKLFDKTGHTAKYIDKDGKKASCTDWFHTPLKYRYKKNREQAPAWFSAYLEGKKITCFFGEHLLKDKTKPVAIVEAPKTAIIASVYFPQLTWIAAGALSYLTQERCQVLSGRKIILYPDLSKPEPGNLTTYEKWNQRAKELSSIAKFSVSSLLENKATEHEREAGLDLADYLIRINPERYITDLPVPIQSLFVAPVSAPVVPPSIPIGPRVEPDLFPLATQPDFVAPVRAAIYHQSIQLWNVEELEQFFTQIHLPAEPIQLYPWETIKDLPLFIERGLGYVKANNGKRAFQPYYDRLNKLKVTLENKAPCKYLKELAA